MTKRLAFFLALALLAGCTRSTNLNTHPDYAGFVGKEYKTKVDLAVVKSSESKSKYIFYAPGQGGLPKKFDEMKSFPFQHESRTIYGILPKGSVLKVVKIQRTRSIEWNMVDYYVTVESLGPFQGQLILALMLTDSDAQPVPKLSAKYMEETTTQNKS